MSVIRLVDIGRVGAQGFGQHVIIERSDTSLAAAIPPEILDLKVDDRSAKEFPSVEFTVVDRFTFGLVVEGHHYKTFQSSQRALSSFRDGELVAVPFYEAKPHQAWIPCLIDCGAISNQPQRSEPPRRSEKPKRHHWRDDLKKE